MSRLRPSNPFFLFLLFTLALLVWMTVQLRSGREGKASPSPVAPAQRLLNFTSRGLVDMWNRYLDLRGVERENERLKTRLQETEINLSRLEETQAENYRLRFLLHMSLPPASRIHAVARVLSWDPATWAQILLLDKGRDDAVHLDQPAVSPQGLLGRVVAVSGSTSRLLLVTDTRSAVAVRLERSRTSAILEGTGRNRARLLYVLKETLTEPGERIVTSGLDGIYPPGIPVGAVVAAHLDPGGIFQEIEVRPFADLATTEEVVILETDSRESRETIR